MSKMKHKNIRGKLAYTSKKPEMLDQSRGHELFHITKHTDGQMTLRAHCEIEEPDPTVMRDVVLTLNDKQSSNGLFYTLNCGDEFMGSGLFIFNLDEDRNGTIECESYGPSIDRVSQKKETSGSFDAFGTHPIVGDGWNCRSIDISNGPGVYQMRAFMPSLDHRGATPPMISELTIGVEYHGLEEINVQAGTFTCHRFSYIDDVGFNEGVKHPPYDIWVTEEDYVCVKAEVTGYMMTYYELVSIEYD